MKLEPVTQIGKRNMVTPKKFDDEVMSANPDVIIFYQFMAPICSYPEPDAGHMVYKTYIFINSNLLSVKNRK